jgi:shikimate kinase
MNQAGLTVYLEMDAKSLTYRLMNAKGDRPLVNKIGEDELLEFVVQQMEERKFYYSEAQIKVNALGFNSVKIKALASQIEEACQSKN